MSSMQELFPTSEGVLSYGELSFPPGSGLAAR
jgi:hypothetical protein